MNRIRISLDNAVRTAGNRIRPNMPLVARLRGAASGDHGEYGLGDFLTQDITRPKVYATIGAIAPVAATFAVYNAVAPGIPFITGIATGMTTIAFFPYYAAFPISGAVMGRLLEREHNKLERENARMQEHREHGNLLGLSDAPRY